MAECAKELLDLNKLITSNIDALALLGHVSHEMSLKRWDAIRPHLKKDYASLCASLLPITIFLFGDDLQAQLNNIRASSRIGQAVTGEQNSFHRWKISIHPRKGAKNGSFYTEAVASGKGAQNLYTR